MPSTRRSTRLASSQNSSSPAKEESPRAAAGSKRKSATGSSPAPKRGKKDVANDQLTIEESMDVDKPEQQSSPQPDQAAPDRAHPVSKPTATSNADHSPKTQTQQQETKISQSSTNGSTSEKPESSAANLQDNEKQSKPQNDQAQDKRSDTLVGASEQSKTNQEEAQGAESQKKEDTTKQSDSQVDTDAEKSVPEHSTTKAESTTQPSVDKQKDSQANGESGTNGSAIQPHARDSETPSSIMEKGLIYFFFRGRVGIEDPSNVQDIQRSHIVLRPLPHGAKLGDGAIGPSENKCRLLALPKKVLPTSGQDRFMTFVEKAHTSFPELRKSFLPADDYETKTAGIRHTPAVKPIAEGVYAITTTGRENHLAYMLSIPSQIGELQKDMGLKEQGSFIVSCKNPQFPGPSYASLPQSPDFPKEILDEFRSLRWMPLQPKHLDYENTQFLLIGESGGLDKAMDVPDDKKDQHADAPKEEMERLEGEDEIRIKHLKGDDAIFADLGISKKDYSQVPTTWDD